MILTLFAVVGLVVVPCTAASAAPGDSQQYTQEQLDAAEKKGSEAAAAAACEGMPENLRGVCAGLLKTLFTAEAITDLGLDAVCGALPGFAETTCRDVVDIDLVRAAFTTAYQGALAAYGVAESGVQIAAFFANPENMLEIFANSVKEDSLTTITSSLQETVNGTAFDATAQWWRESYATSAGIGLAVMVMMLLVTAWQSAAGKISNEDFLASLVRFTPFGALMLVMGPPVAWAFQWVASSMTEGIVAWFETPLGEFIPKAGSLGAMTSDAGAGALFAIAMYGLLMLAGLGLVFTRAVQYVGLYIGGAVIGIAWGMIVNPRWRRKALALPLVWLGVLLSGPLMILLLGFSLMMSNSLLESAGTGELPLGQYLMNAFLVCVAIGVPAFAPYALLKWAPLLPEGSDSVAAAGAGSTSAAVVGAAGSTASQIAMQRANRNTSGGAGTAGPQGAGASGPPPQLTRYSSTGPTGGGSGGGGGPAGTGGRGASNSSSGRFGNLFRSRSSGQGSASAATGAKGAKGAAGGAASTAGKAKAGATAGKGVAGAATGGAYFVAQIGTAAAQSGLHRAKEAAAAAAPQIDERASET